jgi:hypothetical protein
MAQRTKLSLSLVFEGFHILINSFYRLAAHNGDAYDSHSGLFSSENECLGGGLETLQQHGYSRIWERMF